MRKLIIVLILCVSSCTVLPRYHKTSAPNAGKRFLYANPALVLVKFDRGACSGSIVNIDGTARLLTVRHCKATKDEYFVTFSDGKENVFHFYSAGQRPQADWMLLQGDTHHVRPLELNRHPQGRLITTTVGSTVNRATSLIITLDNSRDVFQASGYLIPGDSGSACIDEAGRVVAIASGAHPTKPIAEVTSVEDVR